MYEALTRSSVVIELIEDIEQYEATIVSTNGVILQPYDTSTTKFPFPISKTPPVI